MADVAPLTSGPAAEWLRSRRDELNSRFRAARRRSPRLDPQAVLRLVPELLPPLAGGGEDGTADLLSSVYDLVLLHAGRGTVVPGGGTSRALDVLLRETFPRLRKVLLGRPRSLPAALSNAVENRGARGEELARAMGDMAEVVESPDELLRAVALAAWRLGEARLRASALGGARSLPPRAALRALGLGAWPVEAAPLALDLLEADAWTAPGAAVSSATLEGLRAAAPARLEPLRARARERAAPAAWRLAGAVGDFHGFDGPFEEPPLLLPAAEAQGRHRFWARSGDRTFRLDADVFGWVAGPDAPPGAPPPAPRAKGARADGAGQTPAAGKPPVSVRSATSQVAGADFLAVTTADSFRIRVWAPARSAL